MEDKKSFRVIVYVDGFNLYYGLKDSGFREYYWLDIQKLASTFIRDGLTLSGVKYFTASLSSGKNQADAPWRTAKREEKRKRQSVYLDALKTVPGLEIIYGTFLGEKTECFECKRTFTALKEKMTDVGLATHLLVDAFTDKFDTAYVISGDSDLSPPIRHIVEEMPKKRVVVAFPPNRESSHLKDIVGRRYFKIDESVLRSCQFPEIVKIDDNYQLRRPSKWKSDR